MTPSERELRLKVFEADYGREFGWYVEREGRRLAVLTDARLEDMFWYSYAIEPLAEQEAQRDAVFTESFWAQPGLVFRNRATGEVARRAFAAAAPSRRTRRVSMRALVSALRPSPLERLELWRRSRKATRQPTSAG
jgi:hypothetical protein